jgi:hypothetical protein
MDEGAIKVAGFLISVTLFGCLLWAIICQIFNAVGSFLCQIVNSAGSFLHSLGM